MPTYRLNRPTYRLNRPTYRLNRPTYRLNRPTYRSNKPTYRLNETKSAAVCRNSRFKSSYTSSTLDLTFEKLHLCDENKKVHRIILSRFLYIQQIRIKTGHGQRPYSSPKSVMYTNNSYNVACLNFRLITLGPNSKCQMGYPLPHPPRSLRLVSRLRRFIHYLGPPLDIHIYRQTDRQIYVRTDR